MNTCRICFKDSDSPSINLREMMFATGEEFEYFQCPHCECLQIKNIPNDLGRHYPSSYYSLAPLEASKLGGVGAWVKKQRMQFCVGQPNPVGALARLIWGQPEMSKWFSIPRVKLGAKILDVGCGNGRLLLQLSTYGFRQLHGIDPYLPQSIAYPNGVQLRCQELEHVVEQYDMVMLHHSFEHFTDPVGALHEVHRILAPGGIALIRVPVVDSEAWHVFREYWVQLDAPRHLHIPARRTIGLLAEKCGFVLEALFEDSHAMQFWASEQYKLGIGLRDPRSFMTNPGASIFSGQAMKNFEKRAKQLNQKHQGDQACFFLRRQ